MGLNITDRVPDLINCVFENETQIVGSLKSLMADIKGMHLPAAFGDFKTFLGVF